MVVRFTESKASKLGFFSRRLVVSMPSRQEHHILTRTSFGGGGSAHSVWGGGTYGSYQALAAAAAPPPPWQPSGGYQQWGYHHQSFLKWRTWTQPAGNPFLKGYDPSQFVSIAHYLQLRARFRAEDTVAT